MQNNSNNNFRFWFQIILVVLFPFIFLITQNEFIVTCWVLVLTVSLFLIQREKGEWKVWVLGFVAGIIFEVGGDLIAKMQYWENGSLFGIPVWLPLLWAFGFVFIRRIGNKILKK